MKSHFEKKGGELSNIVTYLKVKVVFIGGSTGATLVHDLTDADVQNTFLR